MAIIIRNKLFITKEVLISLRDYCSDEMIIQCLKGVDYEITERVNKWDVSEYLKNELSEAGIVDKLRFTLCFMECDGEISFCGNVFFKGTRQDYIRNLQDIKLISHTQADDALIHFYDTTESPIPHFELEKR